MINISSGNNTTTLQRDLDRSPKLLLNLSNRHVYLNCYSRLTVKFALLVFNGTTAKISKTFGTTETSETAKYCLMLEQFFDYFNVRSLEKHQKKTKPFLKPYINENALIHRKKYSKQTR